MAQARRTKFTDLKEQAWRTAHEWSKKVARKPLPTPLHDLATLHKIQYIRFEPLLSTAGIREDENGHVIMVNTEAPGVTQAGGTVLKIDSSWNDLEPALRFTLAHEISHLFFLADVEEKDDLKELVLFLGRHNAQLEKTCNEMARVLLIPKQRLISEIRNADQLFDSSHLKRVTTMFRVSPEVFVRRLHVTDMRDAFGNVHGFVAFVRVEDKAFRVVASHVWGPQAQARFRPAARLSRQNHHPVSKRADNPEGCVLRELNLGFDVETPLAGSDYYEKELRVPCAKNLVLPCQFNACLTSSRPRAFLISIRVSGPARDRLHIGRDQSLFPKKFFNT